MSKLVFLLINVDPAQKSCHSIFNFRNYYKELKDYIEEGEEESIIKITYFIS